MPDIVHKLNVKKGMTKTECGLMIIAFYPQQMYAMTDEAGNVKVSLDKGVTCTICKNVVDKL